MSSKPFSFLKKRTTTILNKLQNAEYRGLYGPTLEIQDILILPDDSIIVVGSFIGFVDPNGINYYCGNIVKFLADGSIDTTFQNNAGLGFNGNTNTIATDGTSLYVGGGFTQFGNTANNAKYIAKLSTSGVFDTAFSDNLDLVSGTKSFATSGFNSAVNTIAIDVTSLYVGGQFTQFKNTANNANRIAKLSTSGVFDTAFSDNLDVVPGTKATTSGFNNRVYTIAIDVTSLYVGGEFTQFKNIANARKIAKLSTSGVFDTVFGNNVTSSSFGNGDVYAIVIDGTSLYVGGRIYDFNATNNARGVAKLSTSGVFDTAFSNNLDVVSGVKATTSGFSPTSLTGTVGSCTVRCVAIKGTDLYVGGDMLAFKNSACLGFAKLNTSGVFQNLIQNKYGSGNADSCAVDANGNIYIGTVTYNGTRTQSICKILPNGTLDTAFQNNIGIGFNGRVLTIVIDGTSLYVGGQFTQFGNTANNARYIAKLSTSGVFDTAFSNNLDVVSGTKATTSGFNNYVGAIAIDGTSLYVGGQFTQFKNTANNANRIAKLSTSGVFDTAFSDNLDVVSGVKATTSGFNSIVYTMAINGTSLYVGGGFTQFGNTANNAKYIAKLSTSGVFDTAFSDNLDVVPGTKAATSGFNNAVYTMAIDGTSLYVAGFFTQFKNTANNAKYIAKLSTSGVFDTAFSDNLDVVSGVKATTSGFNSSVWGIAIVGTILYVAGFFTQFKNTANNANHIAKLSTSGVFDTAFSDNLDVVPGTKATTSGSQNSLTGIKYSSVYGSLIIFSDGLILFNQLPYSGVMII